MSGPGDEKILRMTRGAVLAHVTMRGTHHRARYLNMLHPLGVQPLLPSNVAEWTWPGDTWAETGSVRESQDLPLALQS